MPSIVMEPKQKKKQELNRVAKDDDRHVLRGERQDDKSHEVISTPEYH